MRWNYKGRNRTSISALLFGLDVFPFSGGTRAQTVEVEEVATAVPPASSSASRRTKESSVQTPRARNLPPSLLHGAGEYRPNNSCSAEASGGSTDTRAEPQIDWLRAESQEGDGEAEEASKEA